MQKDTGKSSHDTHTNAKSSGHTRSRVVFSGVTFLFLSILLGGARLSNIPPDLSQLAEVVAVALFVAAMVAVAIGMVGQSKRPD